ncbi:MAG: putative serine/threonine-protein kinase iks1 [Chrysothrix sp. TS-e1954]|nr:MAG: putative serine/threonine-protein kinase iks1 [Chrysothrix sp. TS-e1954]
MNANETSHADYRESFVSPSYFKRLAASRNVSRPGSRPTSPPRIQIQPAHDESDLGESPNKPSRSARQKGAGGLLEADPRHISSSSFSQGYYKRFFVEERELGRGGRGVVLLVTHVLDSIDLGKFACKRIPVGDDHEWLEKVLLEVTMAQRNSGTLLDYILGERAHLQRESRREKARRWSKSNRSLSPNLRRGRQMSLEEIFSFFRDIAKGLAHLHAHNFVHRDLKPQNCLLHKTDSGMRVLVSDFGEMRGASTSRLSTATGYTGTVSFAAPEVVERDENGIYGDFTPKSDIFSLGMIVYFMGLSTSLPYASADLDEEHEDLAQLRAEVIAWTGLRDERIERTDLPERLYKYLQLLLSHDPKERPTIQEILQGIKAGAAFNDQGPRHSTGEVSPTLQPQNGDSPSLTNTEPGLSRRPTRTTPSSFRGRHMSSPGDSSRAASPGQSIALEKPRRRENQEEGRLVLQTSFSPEQPEGPLESPLLLPPASKPEAPTLRRVLAHAQVHAVIKLILLVAKVTSILEPCAPSSPRPLFFYPLLIFAVSDLFEITQLTLMSAASSNHRIPMFYPPGMLSPNGKRGKEHYTRPPIPHFEDNEAGAKPSPRAL